MRDTENKTIIHGGAFSVARKTFESELWRNKPASWWKIWCFILGSVQHKNYKELKRGQGFFNFTKLTRMDALGKDVNQDHVENFMRYAKSKGMLTSQQGTHGAVITVINYDEYQQLDNYSGNYNGTNNGTELATISGVENLTKTEQKTEVKTEQERNRNGDINKNDNNDSLLAEKIKKKKHLIKRGDSYFYEIKGGLKKITDLNAFYNKIKDQPDLQSKKPQAQNEDNIYPNATLKRLQRQEVQV